jgi:hypothetical protein
MRGGHAAHPLRYGLVIVLFSLALAVARFLVQGDIGLDLGDEGQLWYVTTRTALGDVPLRDIRSYDPGRYYWGAAWRGSSCSDPASSRCGSARPSSRRWG